MSGIAVVTLAILAISVIIGLVRGLMRSVLTFGHLFISIALMILIAPYMKNILNMTELDDAIYNKIENTVETKIAERTSAYLPDIDDQSTITLPEGYDSSDIPEEYYQYSVSEDGSNNISDDTGAALEQELPGGLLTKFILSRSNAYEYLSQGVQAFAMQVAEYATGLIMKIISALLIFVVSQIIFHIIMLLTEVVDYIPVVGGINKFLGGILGFVIGLGIIWLIYLFMTLLITVDPVASAMEDIADNPLLSILYNVNPLLYLLGR